MALEHEELTGKIIGAAIEVHRQLGPGFIESIYENALVYELRKRGLKVEQQLEMPILYDGNVEVGKHRLDLLVEGEIVIDLKAISELQDIHFSIVRSQLRAVKTKTRSLAKFCEGHARNKARDCSMRIPAFLPSSLTLS